MTKITLIFTPTHNSVCNSTQKLHDISLNRLTHLTVHKTRPSFSSPANASPSFSIRHFLIRHFQSCNVHPVISSVIFQSCNVHPCDLVRHFPVLQCPPLRSRPSFSSPAMYTPAISSVIFQSCNVHPCFFQSVIVHPCNFVRYFPVLHFAVTPCTRRHTCRHFNGLNFSISKC